MEWLSKVWEWIKFILYGWFVQRYTEMKIELEQEKLAREIELKLHEITKELDDGRINYEAAKTRFDLIVLEHGDLLRKYGILGPAPKTGSPSSGSGDDTPA